MGENYFIDVVLNREKLSAGSPIFVTHCPSIGITSQGKNMDEAVKNIKEAIELYLEEQPDRCDVLSKEMPLFSVVKVTKGAKAACVVR